MSRLRTVSEVAKMKMPPWVLPGWLRERTLTMLSAPGGVGKSNLALALSLHIASNRGFLGGDAPGHAGRVVYIGIDAASWDHAHVARRLCRGMDLDPDDLEPREDWEGGLFFCFDPIMLGEKDWEEMLNGAAYGSGALPDLVVVDSLRNIHDKDENSSTDMMAVMRFFRSWSERNCAILLLHHSKKPGEFAEAATWSSARGSTVMHNSVDTHIVLVPQASHRSTEAQRLSRNRNLEAIWVKGRGGDAPPLAKFRFRWTEDLMRFDLAKPGGPMRGSKDAEIRRLRAQVSRMKNT